MSNFEPVISVCRHCRSYHLEGRRGGFCMQLGTPVQGCWTACSYAIPPFAPSWEVPVGINGDLTQLFWQPSPESGMMATVNRSNSSHGEPRTIEVVGSCISNDSDDNQEQVEAAPVRTAFSVKA